MERVWPGTFVEENNLSRSIAVLRRALGWATRRTQYIETVPGRGYRFTAAVNRRSEPSPASPPADATTRARGNGDDRASAALPRADDAPLTPPLIPSLTGWPDMRYARSRGGAVAYQTAGDGAIDLILVTGWVSRLDHQWREPSHAAFLSRLASFSRLIAFDQRGRGPRTPAPAGVRAYQDER
jgi:hypothetical protein